MKTTKIFLSLLFSFVFLLACAPRSLAIEENEVIFFGDSTTAHLAVRGGVPASQVWSGRESTVRLSSVNSERCVYIGGRSMTLAEAVRSAKPKALVITLGVSGGAGVLSESEFKRVYRQMLISVKEASPGTKLFVQSILPLSDKSGKYYKKITKEAVVEANSWIREVCASLSVPYIDSHCLLTAPNGYLKQEYQNDEYMHLTSAAYRVILSNIRKYLNTN